MIAIIVSDYSWFRGLRTSGGGLGALLSAAEGAGMSKRKLDEHG